jgi:peptide chain release factor subunit 1
MALTAHQRFELKKFIKELSSYRAAHTEFVTVYIPEGYDMFKIINHLAQEQGTASNIKSASTRNNVIDALERMIQHLKLFKKTPLHGLAVFSGNILSREGKSDVRVWSIEPPVPLNTRIYKCDKNFELQLLRDMVDIKEMYGLVVMDARDASLALLKGKRIVPLLKTHSHVPGKMKAGGQSAHRFQANRDLAVKEHLKKIADYMKEQFLTREGLKGILVGGPGPNKYDLVEGNFITGDVKKKIVTIKDLAYTGDFGLQELVDKCQDVLAQEEIADEKKIMFKFFNLLATKLDMVAYGEEHVRMAMSMGAVDTLLLSESLDDDVIDEFDELAKKFSTEVKIISTETREGVQLRDIGKIAAILRYPVNI